MNATEIQIIFKAFYNRIIDPSPNDLDCCDSLVSRGFLVTFQEGHRLGYCIAKAGYNFVQRYLWRG